MAVKIRLTRTGGKNDACFRVVAADTAFPRDGRFIEMLGWYDPKRESNNCELKMDRIEHWRSHGAIVSDTVNNLLVKLRKATPPAPPPAAVAEPEPAAVAEAAGAEQAEEQADVQADASEETV